MEFGLVKGPWWGGQFERMVGLIKQVRYKSLGGGHLTTSELEEIALDI